MTSTGTAHVRPQEGEDGGAVKDNMRECESGVMLEHTAQRGSHGLCGGSGGGGGGGGENGTLKRSVEKQQQQQQQQQQQ
ncbi:hypothetical protein VTJ49DRAFT_3231 [Mycothermus thermophilus]|uniref:Uncharacterized protein n=1 Tax=Humicola insolens TaxID=85995 RepID=A0ABR3V840_HUMIN